MEKRESISRAMRVAAFAAVLGQIATAGAAPDCAQQSAWHINAFFDARMESLDADDRIENPCSGNRETAALDIRPGYGFVAAFESGDLYGEVDRYIAVLCDDGRALLKDSRSGRLFCDTR